MTDQNSITVRDALAYAWPLLEQSLIPGYRLDARLLLEHVTGLSREAITGHPETSLLPAQFVAYKELLARRVLREPVSHIIQKREFWGLHFYVTKDTLDPRPDSETLIEAVLARFPDREAPLTILDLGTGTGCLLLTLLTEYPNARGTAVDISPAALEVARHNSVHLGVGARTEFNLSSWGETLTGNFDLIISNPPYIEEADIASLEPEVAHYEPHLALSGGRDGLECYRALAPRINALLRADGIAVLECGKGQENDVSTILLAHNIHRVSYAYDLAGVARCVIATKNTNDQQG
jgi:release factor glutamine methyltransferase